MMTDHTQFLRSKVPLRMSLTKWDYFSSSPGWIQDKFIAVDYHRLEGWDFQIAEIVFTCATISVTRSDYYLSMMVEAPGAQEQQINLGYGAFQRSNRPGSLVFFRLSDLVSLEGQGPYHAIILVFDGPYVISRLRTLWNTEVTRFIPLFKKSFFDFEVEALMKELLAIGRGAKSLLTGPEVVDLILACLLVQAEYRGAVSGELAKSTRRWSIQKVLEYMALYFSNVILRGDLAKVAKMSEGHLARVFQAEMGMSPMAYLKKFRLERVYEMLRTSKDQSIDKIAHACGFVDRRDLYPAFQEEFGISPGTVRG